MNKKKILIVEDDKFFRELLAKKLKENDFEASLAQNSKEAFTYLEKNIPNLIVLDLILPGLDGFEILSIIKKDARIANIPVVVLSNLGQREEIEKAKSLGAVDYMIKINFTLEEIEQKIRQFVTK